MAAWAVSHLSDCCKREVMHCRDLHWVTVCVENGRAEDNFSLDKTDWENEWFLVSCQPNINTPLSRVCTNLGNSSLKSEKFNILKVGSMHHLKCVLGFMGTFKFKYIEYILLFCELFTNNGTWMHQLWILLNLGTLHCILVNYAPTPTAFWLNLGTSYSHWVLLSTPTGF